MCEIRRIDLGKTRTSFVLLGGFMVVEELVFSEHVI